MLVKRRHTHKEAELDITSFMNLMIILVPVLLLSMVFAHTTVLDLKLPDLAAESDSVQEDEDEPKQLEVILRADYLDVNYPAGILLKRLPLKEVVAESEESTPQDAASAGIEETSLAHDFELLTLVLQEVKRRLSEQGVEKRDIFLLSEPNTDYQTIVSAMDAIRSYKTVVVTDVVDAELFPDVSLGDAPEGEFTQAGASL